MLEVVEARCGQTPNKSIIFCTQYQNEGWYDRIYAHPSDKSPISEAIMDRIVHNAYYIDIKEKCRCVSGMDWQTIQIDKC